MSFPKPQVPRISSPCWPIRGSWWLRHGTRPCQIWRRWVISTASKLGWGWGLWKRSRAGELQLLHTVVLHSSIQGKFQTPADAEVVVRHLKTLCSYLLAPLGCKQVWCRLQKVFSKGTGYGLYLLKWKIVCSITPCLVCWVSSSEDAGLCYQTSNCLACSLYGLPWKRRCSGCSSSIKQWHSSSEERSVGKPRAGCHERWRIEIHSGAAVKFFLHASLHTAAFPSVLEESSDINFNSFQQKQIVLY